MRHTKFDCDWSSDVCSSDLDHVATAEVVLPGRVQRNVRITGLGEVAVRGAANEATVALRIVPSDRFSVGNYRRERDRKSTRLNSSHSQISYAVFCLKKKKTS